MAEGKRSGTSRSLVIYMDCCWSSIRARTCSSIARRCCKTSRTLSKCHHPKLRSGCSSEETLRSVSALNSPRRFWVRPQSSLSSLPFCSPTRSAIPASTRTRSGVSASFCYGYALGWFGKLWQTRPVGRVPGYVRSLPGQATALTSALLAVLAAAPIHPEVQEHFIWAFCYGWIAEWLSKRRLPC
jgi:hypothetical protein